MRVPALFKDIQAPDSLHIRDCPSPEASASARAHSERNQRLPVLNSPRDYVTAVQVGLSLTSAPTSPFPWIETDSFVSQIDSIYPFGRSDAQTAQRFDRLLAFLHFH